MIIGFSGPKESGKTTSMNIYSDMLTKKGISNNIVNFADKLKQVCMDVFELSYEQVHGKLKDANIPPIILNEARISKCFEAYGIKRYDRGIVERFGNIALFTPRQVLQIIGTNVLRSHNDNIHTDYVMNAIKQSNIAVTLIGDVRFSNEYLLCDKVLYIENKDKEAVVKTSSHESELQVFTFKDRCDIVDNNYGFDNLKTQLSNQLEKTFGN